VSSSPGLDARRNDDGGFGPVVGAASEPEPTALMALAADDDRAREWLVEHQLDDGSLGLRAGSVFREATAVAAIAMPDGPSRQRAVDRVVAVLGNNGPDPAITARGWPWTDEAHGWVEPTAWGLLALRLLRPTETDRVDDAVALLRERESVDGGWNYGARTILGVDVAPFVQTTGMGLLGLGTLAPDLERRAVAVLERRWSSEADGHLSLATAVCALDVAGSSQARAAGKALDASDVGGAPDNVVAAWATMAAERTGPWWT
jgi:hypothetical protein